MRSDLHDATLRPAADGHALAVVRSVLLRNDVLQDRQFVVVHVKEIVLIILVVVQVDDAEIVRGTLVVPVRPIEEIIAIRLSMFLMIDILLLFVEVIVARRVVPAILIKVPLKNQEVALVVLRGVHADAARPLPRMVPYPMFIVESLDDLVFEAIEDRRVLAQIVHVFASVVVDDGGALELCGLEVVETIRRNPVAI